MIIIDLRKCSAAFSNSREWSRWCISNFLHTLCCACSGYPI